MSYNRRPTSTRRSGGYYGGPSYQEPQANFWVVLIFAILMVILAIIAVTGRSPDAAIDPAPAGSAVAGAAGAAPSALASAGASAAGALSSAVASVEPAASELPPLTGPTIAAALASLRVEPEGTRDGYSRERFKHWIDEDRNGCDTREEVLKAEAQVAPAQGSGCALTGGSWLSLYDGLTFTDGGDLDIDHLVPLAEAWDSGAAGWDDAQRSRYANDLGAAFALIAVSAKSNRSKADQDPAEWLPPDRGYWCRYVADWVGVKLRWNLAINLAEHDRIAEIAAMPDCLRTVVPIAPVIP